MHCLHEQNVLHRDLKPGNILVRQNTEDDSNVSSASNANHRNPKILVKIGDFGYARFVILYKASNPGVLKKKICLSSKFFMHDRAFPHFMQKNSKNSTEVATWCYRAPELLFKGANHQYINPATKEIDVWSLGCIFAELFERKRLFHANCEEQLLKCIVTSKFSLFFLFYQLLNKKT